MLKRLLGELKYEDAKVYHIDDIETLLSMYKTANEVVKKHDVKFVREFKEKKPYEAESWYYGEVKETSENIVIRIGARAEEEHLEIFVASSNLASLTGLLSELGAKLGERISDQDIDEEKIHPESEKRIKEVLEHTKSLLERYAD
jgi:hypothetical protein